MDYRLSQNEQIKKNIVELEYSNQRDSKQIDKLKADIDSIKKDIQKSNEIKDLIETNFENSRFFEKEFIAKREIYVEELRNQMRELEQLKNTNID